MSAAADLRGDQARLREGARGVKPGSGALPAAEPKPTRGAPRIHRARGKRWALRASVGSAAGSTPLHGGATAPLPAARNRRARPGARRWLGSGVGGCSCRALSAAASKVIGRSNHQPRMPSRCMTPASGSSPVSPTGCPFAETKTRQPARVPQKARRSVTGPRGTSARSKVIVHVDSRMRPSAPMRGGWQ